MLSTPLIFGEFNQKEKFCFLPVFPKVYNNHYIVLGIVSNAEYRSVKALCVCHAIEGVGDVGSCRGPGTNFTDTKEVSELQLMPTVILV